MNELTLIDWLAKRKRRWTAEKAHTHPALESFYDGRLAEINEMLTLLYEQGSTEQTRKVALQEAEL